MPVGKMGEELARFLGPDPEARRTVAFALMCLRQRQRQRTHAGQQVLRVVPARNVIGQNAGIELVLGQPDAGGQRSAWTDRGGRFLWRARYTRKQFPHATKAVRRLREGCTDKKILYHNCRVLLVTRVCLPYQ